jgi:hypothetical protein
MVVFRFAILALVASSAQGFAPAPKFATRSSSLDMSSGEFDFDVAIIGCGVGGHGAALHSRGQSLKTVVFAGGDVGGTCVNRGCVPSKALLAASGRVRDMKNSAHLSDMGIEVDGEVKFSREGIAAHAKNLANRVKGNLEASLVGLGVDVVEGRGILTGNPHEIKDSVTGKVYTAKVSRQCVCSLDTLSIVSSLMHTLFSTHRIFFWLLAPSHSSLLVSPSTRRPSTLLMELLN